MKETKGDLLNLLMRITDVIAPIRDGNRSGTTFARLSIIDDEIQEIISNAIKQHKESQNETV